MENFLKGFHEQGSRNFTEYAQTNKEQLDQALKTDQTHWTDLPNALENPAQMKKTKDLLSMAYQLQAEVKEKNYPMDFNYRQERMGEKYKVLMDNSLALFNLAIMEELDKHEDILSIFKQNLEDPKKIRRDMENLVSQDFYSQMKNFVQKNKNSKDPEIQSFINAYKPPQELEMEKSSVSEVLEDHQNKTQELKPRSKEELLKKYTKK